VGNQLSPVFLELYFVDVDGNRFTAVSKYFFCNLLSGLHSELI
jgi:hypothetical protein